MPTAQDYVDAGFAVLQADDPTGAWLHKVDLDNLYMSTFDKCVLGYVYGYFLDGLAKLRPDLAHERRWLYDENHPLPGEMMKWACDHGFAFHDCLGPFELRDAWIRKITAARAALAS